MTSQFSSHVGKLAMLGGFVLLPMCLSGQQKDRSTSYRLFEIGPFGGPNSYYNGGTSIATRS